MCSQQMQQSDMVSLVWSAVMEAVEFSKKSEFVNLEALKQINTYAELLAAFTPNDQLQTLLIKRAQIFCYENQILLKYFAKMVLLLYKRTSSFVCSGFSTRNSSNCSELPFCFNHRRRDFGRCHHGLVQWRA